MQLYPDSINIKGTLFDLTTPKVMGILNATDNSFYDGGKFLHKDKALEHAALMLKEGADIIDVGGASSRPGAKPVSKEQEQDRVLPIIETISTEFPEAILSIDTNCGETAAFSIQSGAHIVNDISAGDDDSAMLETVGRLKVPYIAMHKQGTPQNHARKSAIRRCCLRHCAVLLAKTRKIQTTWHTRCGVRPGIWFWENG